MVRKYRSDSGSVTVTDLHARSAPGTTAPRCLPSEDISQANGSHAVSALPANRTIRPTVSTRPMMLWGFTALSLEIMMSRFVPNPRRHRQRRGSEHVVLNHREWVHLAQRYVFKGGGMIDDLGWIPLKDAEATFIGNRSQDWYGLPPSPGNVETCCGCDTGFARTNPAARVLGLNEWMV